MANGHSGLSLLVEPPQNVDGVIRHAVQVALDRSTFGYTYRAEFLKHRNPQSEVKVKDLQSTGWVTPFASS